MKTKIEQIKQICYTLCNTNNLLYSINYDYSNGIIDEETYKSSTKHIHWLFDEFIDEMSTKIKELEETKED